MRVCIISGAPPGGGDGVGGFSACLAETLGRAHEVVLVTAAGPGLAGATAGTPVHAIRAGWGLGGCRDAWRLVTLLDPDVILVQFVPELYGWRGSKPGLALLLAGLGRRGRPIVTVAHEVGRPFQAFPPAALEAAAHRALLRMVVAASRLVVLTTPFVADLLARRFPGRRPALREVPVGSTIPVVPLDARQALAVRRRLGAGDELLVATFGVPTAPAPALLAEVLEWLVDRHGARILALGRTSDDARREWARRPRLARRVTWTGPIAAAEVSRGLSASDLFVAFYADGASTRRTSLMAGLAHGLATVSNVGPLTDAALRGSGALHLVEGVRWREQADELGVLAADRRRRADLGGRARALHAERYSWERIGARYGALLEEAVSG